MALLHQLLRGFFALLLAPPARLGPLAGLTLISTASGLVMLVAFRFTSRPRAIRNAKRRIQANLLAVRIYREDLWIVFRSQARVFAALGAYMGNMIVPFLAILIPFALLFAHLDARYGSRALHPGERAIVKAALVRGELDGWRLEAAGDVAVDSPPVRIPSRGEIDWRVRAAAPGRHRMELVSGSRRVPLEVVVTAETTGTPPRRSAPGLSSLFFAPAESPIDPRMGVRSLEIGYPPLRLPLFGWKTHWIVIFLAVSAIVALALRKRAGVEF